jgi:hypothetical protein
MVAKRIIDDHTELVNIGVLAHEQLDSVVSDTPFLVLSGSNSDLASSSRRLVAGSGITLRDSGPAGDLTITADVTGSNYTFENDLTVSLSGGRSFGRYASGEKIPAQGKTPAEVILLAIAEPIDPTVSLTTPTSILFNQTSINNILDFSYTINSLGASVTSAVLEWRRNNSGAWTTLSVDTNLLTYTHGIVDTNYNTQSFNYRYTVIDTLGATSIVTLGITPQSYVAPSLSLSLSESVSGGIAGESTTKREKGNANSTLNGTITRSSVNVPMTSYSVQYQVNGSGSWSDVPGLSNVVVSGNPSSVSIPLITHSDVNLKTSVSLSYRILVIDEYQSHISSFVTGGNTTINFLNVIFYSSSSSVPSVSSDVRSLSNKIFADGTNPFTLNTGNIDRNFSVAVPSNLSITKIVDIDALNADITTNYVQSTFNVNDAGGSPVTYHVYTLTNAIPYGSNHRHQVTRA